MRGFGAVAGSSAVLVLCSHVFAGNQVAVDHLSQHWVRSYEEEQPGQTVQVFRPASSMAFPPSRFRMAFKFARSGSCELYVLSPDDAHRFEACTWNVAGSDHDRLEITEAGGVTHFKVLELSKERLRLEPIE